MTYSCPFCHKKSDALDYATKLQTERGMYGPGNEWNSYSPLCQESSSKFYCAKCGRWLKKVNESNVDDFLKGESI